MKIQVNNEEYTVKWVHKKVDKNFIIQSVAITAPKTTLCIVNNIDEFCVGSGLAVCSISDAYNKEIGRKISLSRALEDAEFDKGTRTKFWEAYRTMGGKERWEKN